MTIIGPDSIFILDFKIDIPDESAISQILTFRFDSER